MRSVKARKTPSVGEIAATIAADGRLGEDDFIKTLKKMVSDGSLSLSKPSYELESGWDYMLTVTLSGWLWGTIGLTVLAVLSVALVPDVFPINAVRWVLGSIFVLYLPGHALIQLLFPKRTSELDSLERFALSIGLSLALVPLIGLVLNYTPWGIRLNPVVTSLSAFTVLCGVAAAVRGYRQEQAFAQVGE
jgi:hypothetical protein